MKLLVRMCLLLLLALSWSACGGQEPAPQTAATRGKEQPVAKASQPTNAKPLAVSALPDGAPRLAIVLDDMGRDRAAAERLLALDVPITFAVIPNLPFSTETAAYAHQSGREVMLHLPMTANGERGPAQEEAVELRPGMAATDVAQMLEHMLDAVPYVVGVNNHQGSRATQDRALMSAVMPVLKSRNLFFLDSRTSAASIAYDVAQEAGLRAAYRTEFLDDTPERLVILRQLQTAERRAREHGWAIAIGHPHAVTLDVLTEMLPQMQARGIRLVFVSQIAK